MPVLLMRRCRRLLLLVGVVVMGEGERAFRDKNRRAGEGDATDVLVRDLLRPRRVGGRAVLAAPPPGDRGGFIIAVSVAVLYHVHVLLSSDTSSSSSSLLHEVPFDSFLPAGKTKKVFVVTKFKFCRVRNNWESRDWKSSHQCTEGIGIK